MQMAKSFRSFGPYGYGMLHCSAELVHVFARLHRTSVPQLHV